MWGGGLLIVQSMSESHIDKIVCLSKNKSLLFPAGSPFIIFPNRKKNQHIFSQIFIQNMYFLGGKQLP